MMKLRAHGPAACRASQREHVIRSRRAVWSRDAGRTQPRGMGPSAARKADLFSDFGPRIDVDTVQRLVLQGLAGANLGEFVDVQSRRRWRNPIAHVQSFLEWSVALQGHATSAPTRGANGQISHGIGRRSRPGSPDRVSAESAGAMP